MTESKRKTGKITDKERLDWLTRQQAELVWVGRSWELADLPGDYWTGGKTPRQCIDAAIRAIRAERKERHK